MEKQRIFSSEAAKFLGIGVSTLRNYAVTLEAKGHRFERGPNKGRIFYQDDLELLGKMIEKISKENITIAQAAEAVVVNPVQNIDQPVDSATQLEKLCEQLSQLEDQQSKFTEINLALAKQVERLTEKIEERERDQELFKRLHNTREKKKRKGIAILRPLTNLTGKR